KPYCTLRNVSGQLQMACQGMRFLHTILLGIAQRVPSNRGLATNLRVWSQEGNMAPKPHTIFAIFAARPMNSYHYHSGDVEVRLANTKSKGTPGAPTRKGSPLQNFQIPGFFSNQINWWFRGQRQYDVQSHAGEFGHSRGYLLCRIRREANQR